MLFQYFHIRVNSLIIYIYVYNIVLQTEQQTTRMPMPNNVKWSADGFCELNYQAIIAVLNGMHAVNDKIDILEGIRWVK